MDCDYEVTTVIHFCRERKLLMDCPVTSRECCLYCDYKDECPVVCKKEEGE